MAKVVNYQLFTTDMLPGGDRWFPMDHIFYAPYYWTPKKGLHERGKVVHVETHANISKASGMSVSVIRGEGKKAKAEEYDTLPQALRRMADIIEEHESARK